MLVIPKTCNMGGTQVGLEGVIGLTLLNPNGSIHTARATTGIYEIGTNTGCYGKNITFDDNWRGILEWDTGGGSPVYAIDDCFLDAGVIADVVWDELQEDHIIENSFGKKIGDQENPPSQTLSDYKANVTNLDVEVSTRSSHSASDIWAVGTRTLTSFGTLVADIWNSLTLTLTTIGSIGKLLVDNIDTPISSVQGGDATAANQTLIYNRIGEDGNALSSIPWNANWDNEVQSDVDDALVTFFTSSEQLVDDFCDEVLTVATHNVPSSLARRIRAMQEFQGYENGAVWIDTINGVAGTTLYENGTERNPVNNLADATTIALAIKSNRFEILGISYISLTQAYDSFSFNGIGYSVDLNGQSISGCRFKLAVIIGNDNGTNANLVFFDTCHMLGNVLGKHILINCFIDGNMGLSETATYLWKACVSHEFNGSMPHLDYGVGNNASSIGIHQHSGSLEIENMGAGTGTYYLNFSSVGNLIFNANCSALSNAIIGGNVSYVDHSGDITISDDMRIDVLQILNAVIDDAIKIDGSALNTLSGHDPGDILATETNQTNILDKLLSYFQLALRSDSAINTDKAVELIEINADEGSGIGDYDNQTASQETIQAQLALIFIDTDFLQKVENGEWELVSPNILYFYEKDTRTSPGVGTILRTFTCYDADGNPTVTEIARVK